MASSALRSTLRIICLTIGIPTILYFGIISVIIANPSLQTHLIYQHGVNLTQSKDLNAPEHFGFAHHQTTPFYIPAPDGGRLHSWHILPLATYIDNQPALLAQQRPRSGPVDRIEETLNFQLLRENPNARLVLYFHGASGSMGSGWRPDSYRALYAADPVNTHIIVFDYRGFGESTGEPSEPGLIQDAIAVADWAMGVAGIPPERILIYGQSLGCAVSIALVHELARGDRKIHFAGLVITAAFMDVARLTATYRIQEMIPVLSPIAKIPPLFDYFTSHLSSKWDNQKRLGEFIEAAEEFDITILHAMDDTVTPWVHSEGLFQHATSVVEKSEMYAADDGHQALTERRSSRKQSLGDGGSLTSWPTTKGEIRLQVLTRGLHDQLTSYPVISIAVDRAFRSLRKFTHG